MIALSSFVNTNTGYENWHWYISYITIFTVERSSLKHHIIRGLIWCLMTKDMHPMAQNNFHFQKCYTHIYYASYINLRWKRINNCFITYQYALLRLTTHAKPKTLHKYVYMNFFLTSILTTVFVNRQLWLLSILSQHSHWFIHNICVTIDVSPYSI